MLSQIINSLDMSNGYDSDWIPLFTGEGQHKAATSLQVVWGEVTGTLDGTIEILVSNDAESGVVAVIIEIDIVSNIEDSTMISIYPFYRFLKMKYTKNAITGGVLNAVLNFSKY